MSNDSINPALVKYATLMIEKIKSVGSDWTKPWFTSMATACNLTGRKYNNFNRMLLNFLCESKHYQTPVFLTFKQAKKENLSIIKGSEGFPVIYYDFLIKHKVTGQNITLEQYKALSKTAKEEYKVNAFLKHYTVFNLDQTNMKEKFPERWNEIVATYSQPQNLSDGYANKYIDELIEKQKWLCPIYLKHQDKAFYTLKKDYIQLPTKNQFPSGKEFYYTALHEIFHSTGHPERLNRPMANSFGSIGYSDEELKAELGSALVGKDLGLEVLPRKENAQYLKNWLEHINQDPKYILKILTDVSKGCNMIDEALGITAFSDTANESKEKAMPIVGEITYLSLGGRKEKETIGYNDPQQFIRAIKDELYMNPTGFKYKVYSEDLKLEVKKIISKEYGIDMNESIESKSKKLDKQNGEYSITDKLTGETSSLDCKGFDLSKASEEEVRDLLSGKKVELADSTGNKKPVSLSKSVSGWCLQVGKQVFSEMDSSATI